VLKRTEASPSVVRTSVGLKLYVADNELQNIVAITVIAAVNEVSFT